MADLEAFRKMIRRYYRQTYRKDGKTKHQQQDLADMIVMNEDELGKRLNGYRDEKTGRVWRLTEENVLDIVLVLAEWQALNGKQAVELLALMDYPLETSSAWKVRLQKHFSPSELAQFPMSKRTPSAIVPVALQGGQLLQPHRRLFQARDLPKGYVLRSKAFNEIKRLLLNHQENQTTAITTALRGAGGFGKTTLALALCHDPEIQATFPDGILWIELGEYPPRPLDVLNGVLHALEPTLSGALTLEEARENFRVALQGRVCLMVIDDVWQTAALEPLLEGGLHCMRLVTTRNDQVLPEEAARIWVDAMEPEEAIAVLNRGLPEEIEQVAYQPVLETLARRLGYWPLLLTLAHGLLVAQVRRKRTLVQALALIEQAYETRGVLAFDPGDATDRQRAIKACIEVSLHHLEEWISPRYQAVQRYQELAVFPEAINIPLETLQHYWQGTGGLATWEVDDLCIDLHGLSLLLACDLNTNTIRLHDVMRSYLVQRSETNLPTLHARFLDSSRQMLNLKCWADLPAQEHYLWKYLVVHLCAASCTEEIQTTLADFSYLTRKTLYEGASALEADLHLASTCSQPDAPAHALFVFLHRSILRLSHLLRQAQTAAEMGVLLLSHFGWDPRFVAQCQTLEHELPRPFVTAWHPLPQTASAALIRTLYGHTDTVMGCAVSPDSRFIVSASSDGTLKVWDAVTGAERFTLTGHTLQVNGCVVSPDGSFIVSASSDGTLKVWDAATGAERLTLKGHTRSVNGCAVSPDGRFIVSASGDRTVKVWDAATGVKRFALTGHASGVTDCAVSPDGRFIVSALRYHALKVWDAASGVKRFALTGHTRGIRDCAVSPDSRFIVSASSDGTLKVWDVATGAERLTLTGHTSSVNGCAVSPDGRFIVSASSDGTLKVWDAATGAERLSLKDHTDTVFDCVVSPDGRFIVSASSDHTLKVWESTTEAERFTLSGHTHAVNDCAVSPDGGFTVSASDDHTLKVWDTATGAERLTLTGHTSSVNGCAVSLYGRFIVSASQDSTLKVWDIATGAERLTLIGHTSSVIGCAVSPYGSFIVSASLDHTLKVWSVLGFEFFTLRGHTHIVYGCAVSPDGRFIVSASWDRTLKVWDAVTGAERFSLTGHASGVTGCAVSPDGRFIVSASDDHTLKVWDAATGVERFSLIGHTSSVNGCAVSPDGHFIVSASDDHTLKVWDAQTGQCLLTFSVNRALSGCAFHPDGKHLVACGQQGVYFLRLVV